MFFDLCLFNQWRILSHSSSVSHLVRRPYSERYTPPNARFLPILYPKNFVEHFLKLNDIFVCLFFAPRGHNNCFYQYKYMIKLWSHKYITNAVYRQSERAPKNQCSHNGGKIWENINSALQQAMLQLWCQSLPGRYHCLLYGQQGERKKTKHEILHFYHRRYLWLFHSH